jgi:Domain of unknown function (DUF3560)
MTTITITHRDADGTLIEGSRKGDGAYETLLGLRDNWRYFPSMRQIGLGQSRDKTVQQWKIDRAADALRAAGFDVTVNVDEGESRPFAEIEAERYERAEERADRFEGYAENASARSDAAYAGVRRIADGIPFGQPILVGHHSEGRARRDQERMHNGMRKSIAEADKADYLAGRAAAAESYREHREDVPRTLRRIEKLEADARGIQRALDGRLDYVSDGKGGHKLTLVKPGDDHREQLEHRADRLAGELAYWREHVAAREAEGVKVWSRADFAKGDFAHGRWGWAEVLRVNAKSVTIPWGSNAVHLPVVTRDNVTTAVGGPGWTEKVTYDDVRGRKSAAEMTAALAAAEGTGG